MKKKMRLFLAAALALSLAATAAACGDPAASGSSAGGGSSNGGSSGSSPAGSGTGTETAEDTYQDYSPDKQPGDDQFDFDGNYEAPELTIDGLGDDEQWQGVQPLTTFGKSVNGQNAASVKVYRGESALFFLFEVNDSVLLTQGVTNDDAVTHGDSIELYLDTLMDGGRSPQSDDYQLNLGIHGKTRIMQGAGGLWGNWNGLIDYEIALNGTLNDGEEATDTGYSVEVMIPYSQIMIEKDDTIGIAFGQVDKIREEDAATGSETASWNWYGWSYNGSAVNPQIPDQYILLGADNTLVSRDEQVKPPADMAGNVTDSDGAPVEGATVTAVWGDTTLTATTDANGYFVIEDVDPEGTYSVTVEKEGYLAGSMTYTRAELRDADGGIVLKDFVLTATADLETTTIAGTVKNVAYGAVEGATVALQGTLMSTTTAADGSFSLEGVPSANGDITLVVSKSGYADETIALAETDLVTDGTTALGDVNLSLPASETRNFGNLAGLAENNGYISRTLEGIRIDFTGQRTFNGWIELYFDTKTTGASRDGTDVQYQLFADGRIAVINYGDGSFTTDGIEWTVNRVEGAGYTATLLVPYSTLGIGALEPFGISLGQSNGQTWDGWGRDDMLGTNGIGFVAPEIPTDYVRVNALNGLYQAADNNQIVTFSGSTGVPGITVSANGVSVVSGQGGSWSMNVPVTGGDVTVTYSGAGYVSQETVVPASYFDGITATWSENVTMEAKEIELSGTVTDQNGDPVEGVTVKLTYAGGETLTATTNADGEYVFEGVTALADVTLSFEKEGYATGTETRTAAQLDGADGSLTVDKAITSNEQIAYVTLKGNVVGVNGGISGAQVTAGDFSATTGADGSFTIENFPLVDASISISADGYLSATVSFRAADFEGETQATLSDSFLALDYVALGGAFGTKADTFAGFVPYVTRGEDAFLFRFEGSRPFIGNVEFFLDTGLSAGMDGRNATDYLFRLYADGSVSVDNFGGSNTGITTLGYVVSGADTTNPVLTFSVPYAFLGVERDEIVGVTFGQSITVDNTSDWDGWSIEGIQGVDGLEFVQPERPWDYIRIGTDNKPFWNAENISLEELDLTGYNLHFGRTQDSIHAKVSRGEDGVTFEFVTLGDFGIHDGTNTDYVLLYFDTGAQVGGWDGVDYLVKIDKDGNVYGNGGAWWFANDGYKIGQIEITRENGITKFSYTVSYSTIGVAADEVFGFTLVEGWRTDADNGSGEYGGFLYTYNGGSYVVADAAATAGYVRITADGTLVVAGSNDVAE